MQQNHCNVHGNTKNVTLFGKSNQDKVIQPSQDAAAEHDPCSGAGTGFRIRYPFAAKKRLSVGHVRRAEVARPATPHSTAAGDIDVVAQGFDGNAQSSSLQMILTSSSSSGGLTRRRRSIAIGKHTCVHCTHAGQAVQRALLHVRCDAADIISLDSWIGMAWLHSWRPIGPVCSPSASLGEGAQP